MEKRLHLSVRATNAKHYKYMGMSLLWQEQAKGISLYFLENTHKLPEKLLIISHLDGHITTDLKPDMLSGIKTGYRMPQDPKMYVALRMDKHAEKTTFSSKDD